MRTIGCNNGTSAAACWQSRKMPGHGAHHAEIGELRRAAPASYNRSLDCRRIEGRYKRIALTHPGLSHKSGPEALPLVTVADNFEACKARLRHNRLTTATAIRV